MSDEQNKMTEVIWVEDGPTFDDGSTIAHSNDVDNMYLYPYARIPYAIDPDDAAQLLSQMAKCADCQVCYIDHDGFGSCGCKEAARIDAEQKATIATLTADRAAFKDTAAAMTDKAEAAIARVAEVEAERDALQAIVDKLKERTADGVLVGNGDTVYRLDPLKLEGIGCEPSREIQDSPVRVVAGIHVEDWIGDWYSTPDAAKAGDLN